MTSRITAIDIGVGDERLRVPVQAGTALRHQSLKTKTQYVEESIRASIVDGLLPEGAEIMPEAMADALGVSATPVREAMRSLHAEGLVDSPSQKRATVARITLEDLDEIVRIRSALEPMAVSEAAKSIDRDVLEMSRGVAASLPTATEWREWVYKERLLHRVLYSTIPSRRLATLVSRLTDSALIALSSSHDRIRVQELAHDDHELILTAAQAQNRDRWAEAAILHAELPLRDG